MKILAFAASTSRSSLNKQLVSYAADLACELGTTDTEAQVIDLNDFEPPLFSTDIEAELGTPEPAQRFFDLIGSSDALIISFAEHNGNYTAAYKNLFDWVSRIDTKLYQEKPIVMLATSPGKRGGKSVLEIATNRSEHFGAVLKAQMSVPSFHENFNMQTGEMTNPELLQELKTAVGALFS